MFSHLTLCFATFVALPADAENGHSFLFQRPFLRLIGSGPAWVALFFILSGFVNALKPIKQARAGQVENALSGLAVSSFRRSFRLFLPAAATTCLSWTLCQTGAYETARNSDAYWIQITSPQKSWSVGGGVKDLVEAVRTTWLYNPENPYDQPQWALIYLLQGSMYVFAILLVTVNLTPLYRTATLVLCWFWSWNWGIRIGDRMFPPKSCPCLSPRADLNAAIVGPNMFAGVLFAEYNHSNLPLRISRYSSFFFVPLTLLSLLMMSFPSERQHYATWSRTLLDFTIKFGPTNVEHSRFTPTLGAQLLCFTILSTPILRRVLSMPAFLWLGKISFPLYLLHGSLMRSVLAWLMFSGETLTAFEERHEGQEGAVVTMKYPLPSRVKQAIVLPIFFVILGFASHYWSVKVEPHFGVITKRAEEIMFGKETKPTTLPVRKD